MTARPAITEKKIVAIHKTVKISKFDKDDIEKNCTIYMIVKIF